MRWNHDSPRSTALRSGARAGGGGDPLGPARGVLVFLLGEAQQDVLALRVALAVGEVLVGGRRLDLAAPHLLDGGQVALVDRHRLSRSAVRTPRSCRCRRRSAAPGAAALRSIWPRCRSGIRSDIAMYSRLADDNASTYGRMLGTTCTAPKATSAPSDARARPRRRSASARGRGCSRTASRIATSPTSCGISCAATAIAVLMPSGTEVMHRRADDRAVDEVVERVADEARSGAVAPCTWHSSVWQWRSSTSFSSMKKSRMPASSVPNTAGGASSVERLGQQREQRHAEQRADRVADQPRHEARPHVVGEEQQRRGDEQTAAAAEKTQPERGREQMHATFYVGWWDGGWWGLGGVGGWRNGRSESDVGSSRRSRGARARGSCGCAPPRGSSASGRPSCRWTDSPGSTACSTRRRCSRSPG